MQGGNDQMSSLCRRQSRLDGFFITHLADQDDIRSLTERCAKTGYIAFCIQADLSLSYNTLIMAVQILDRILQRDNVSIARFVDLINDAGKSRALTASCRSGHQHKALRHLGDFNNHIRNMQVSKIRKIEGDHTDDRC